MRRAGDLLCAGVGNLGRIARSCRSDSSSWIVSVTVAMLGGSAGALQTMPRAGIVGLLFAIDFTYENGLCDSPLDAIPFHSGPLFCVQSLQCSQKSADSEDCQESTNTAKRRDDIARHFLLRHSSSEAGPSYAVYAQLYSDEVTCDKDYSAFAHNVEMQDKRSGRVSVSGSGTEEKTERDLAWRQPRPSCPGPERYLQSFNIKASN